MTARSIGAVLAGLVAIFVVTTAIDIVLHVTGVFPPWGQPMSDGLFALATSYRILISVGGAWITARLAPSRPVAHAVALAIVGIIFTAAVTIATWNRGPQFGPHWYPLVLIAISIPSAWLGAWMYTRGAVKQYR